MTSLRYWRLAPALLLAPVAYGTGSAQDGALFQAIRANDAAQVSTLLKHGAPVMVRNPSGDTPLMYAALYADPSILKMLLDKRADPNAENKGGVTALMWAVPDVAKMKLLLDGGAYSNARSQEGRTALLIAARQHGSLQAIRLLLNRRADWKITDAMGGTALVLAAEAGDLDVIQLLIDEGADIQQNAGPFFGMPRFGKGPPDMPPPPPTVGITPVIAAAAAGNTEVVKFLLEKGADPNRQQLMGYSPLMYAALQGNVEMVRALLAKGADVAAREFRKATLLILSAASDKSSVELVSMLVEKGAELGAKDSTGQTAMEWASKRGHTPVASYLRRAAAGPDDEKKRISQAVERSFALLQEASFGFTNKTGCISCHNQSMAQMAFGAARERGFAVDEEKARRMESIVAGVAAPHRETMLQGVPTIPATTIVSSYALIGLGAEHHPADEVTDALVIELAARQRGDGHWHGEGSRPPIDEAEIAPTALTIRALQLYGPAGRKREFDGRIRRAAAWLASAPAQTTQDKNMRLMGLTWANADPEVIRGAAQDLLASQRPDGGWSQLPLLESDAYATGMALVALHSSGALKAGDDAYCRGVAYLLDTQQADGSWHVRSRAFGFQPYHESGYPYERDQWISAAGAAWATHALVLTGEPKAVRASR